MKPKKNAGTDDSNVHWLFLLGGKMNSSRRKATLSTHTQTEHISQSPYTGIKEAQRGRVERRKCYKEGKWEIWCNKSQHGQRCSILQFFVLWNNKCTSWQKDGSPHPAE